MTGDADIGAVLAAAVKVRCAVHAGGLVGGVGLKALDLAALQAVLQPPAGHAQLRQGLTDRIYAELQTAGIVYGLQEDHIESAVGAFLEAIAAGSTAPVTRRVAEGDAPAAARDGYLEYPLNHRGLPFAELVSLAPGSPQRKRTVVHAGDVLAVEHPPTLPQDGTSVAGDRLAAAATAATRALAEVAGPRTVVDGDQLRAECDGLCEEDAAGWLRVVPEIFLRRVDQATGRVPEAGISAALIAVVEGITGGPGVATTEAVFVGVGPRPASVEGRAGVLARDLIVHGDILGQSDIDGGRLELSGLCVARQVRNRAIEAARILVAEDCHFARLHAELDIRVDGSLRGGSHRCSAALTVGADLGTEAGGSNTVVSLPTAADSGRRTRRTVAEAGRHRAAATDLREQLDDLERRGQKRAKANDFWAKLLAGERPEPRTPMQARTRAKFVEFHEERTTLQRRLQAEERAVARLVEADLPDDGEAPAGLAVVVGGTIHADVTFEVTRGFEDDEDGDLPVAFTVEGEHLTRTLADVRARLLGLVSAYREQESARLEERRKALEELHKGQERRPEAPTLADRTFAQTVAFVEPRAGEDLFAPAAEVSVRALQPDQVWVRTAARLKAAATGVTVHLGSEGARGTFRLEPNAAPVALWQADPEVRAALAQVVVHGVDANAVLAGTAEVRFDGPADAR